MRPGVRHVVVAGWEVWTGRVVGVTTAAEVLVSDEVVEVVFVVSIGSRQFPNHEYFLHVAVVVTLVDVDDEDEGTVVDSSRQPHQPGVLHVDVLVEYVVDVLNLEVVGADPLLSKYFQLKQSKHSESVAGAGTLG
ncbi:MAG: hypothetical protein Q9187_005789 [Circinaria calcarea]